MEIFEAYSHATVSVAAFALLTLILAGWSSAAKGRAGVVSGGAPEADYANPAYRLYRAHMNAVEMVGPFTAVTLAAILAGASPLWVNWLASIFFVSRLVHAWVHVSGKGKPDGGLRSWVFVVGMVMCVLLGLMAIVAGFM
ncbi:MAPEG family protein [Sulfitobacter sp. LCG007]